MTKKIAIIGGGIIGSTAAYYLSQDSDAENIEVTMFDDGNGQATKAAAGIISPWLSKRRNKKWYNLAQDGATLLKQIAMDTNMPEDIYNQCGTIITRDNPDKLQELYDLALKRTSQTETIGDVIKLTPNEVKEYIPILDHSLPGVYVSGGARLDGAKYTNHLKNIAKKINLSIINDYAKLNDDGNILVNDKLYQFDKIILATGAWTKKVLESLPLTVDTRAQKGQLIELAINQVANSDQNMPVLMPEGESDFIPVGKSRLIIGASHEDDKGFDLSIDDDITDSLLNSAKSLVNNISVDNLIRVKTGTRGYTNDYGPFFGVVPGYKNILVGGGLGSSGLTTGPLVGKILANLSLNHNVSNLEEYRKPIVNYIKLNNN